MSIHEILQGFNPWWTDHEARPAGLQPVRRDVEPRLLSFLATERRRAGALLGPRQVGKTTILLQIADDLLRAGTLPQNLLYFDFSDERIGGVSPRDVFESAPWSESSPETPRFALLDEITRFKEWDLWLKQMVDRQPGTRILVTDSSAAWLSHGGRESGQGRWDEIRIEGLTFREFVRLRTGKDDPATEFLHAPRLVELFLAIGGFPEHAWNDGTQLAELHRRTRVDIADRAIYRDLAQFKVDVDGARALFAYLVQQSGGLFDPTARARDLGVDRRTVSSWLDWLKSSCLLASLDRRTSSAAAKSRGRQKIYAFDHGLVPAFSLSAKPVEDPFTRGVLYEAAVFREIRSLEPLRLSYFRLDQDLEIDFVVDLPNGAVAVEVTSSPRVRQEKIVKLERACRRAKVSRAILVHGGYQREVQGIVEMVPIPGFLLDSKRILEGRE